MHSVHGYRIVFIIGTILSIVVGVYNMLRISLSPTDECTWIESPHGVRVEHIREGGTAQKAGLREGDIILFIGGENVTDARRAQSILNQQRYGETVSYFVMRQGEMIEFNVMIARLGLPPLYLAMCILGFLFLIVGLWIAWMRPNDAKGRLLFFLFLSFFLFWTLNLIPNVKGTLLWTLLLLKNLSFTAIPALFLYFFLLYPQPHPWVERKKGFKIVIFLPPMLFLTFLTLAVVFHLPFFIDVPSGAALWGLYILMGLLRLGRFYRRSRDIQLRQQIRVLAFGLAIGFIPSFLTIIPSLFGAEIVFARYCIPLMGIIPLVFAYAVVRHRLMDIEIIAKKSFVYTLLTGLILGFYFLVVQLAVRFIQNLGGLTGVSLLSLTTLLVTVVFIPLRQKIQHLVDRAFYREAYDYRETLRQFVRSLNTLMDAEVLTKSVLQQICQTMHIGSGFVYLKLKKETAYTMHTQFPESAWPDTHTFSKDHPFIRILSENKNPVPLSEYGEALHPYFKSWQNTGISVPIGQDQELKGFILLDAKQSQIPFSAEDFDLLATVSGQFAIALENSRLHEDLTDQERIKKELEIARHIQINSLPRTQPVIPGFDIYGCSMPAYEVGGDYYDYLDADAGRLGLVVGDVSGKGTSAALYMSKIQGFFRALAPSENDPRNLLCRINQLAYNSFDDQSFVTLVLAMLNFSENEIEVLRAGHPAPLYYDHRKNGCQLLLPRGLALAMDGGGLFSRILESRKLTLEKGDALLFYSDGILEAENSHAEEFGEKRLESVFTDNVAGSASVLGERVIRTVQDFAAGCHQKDDMTLVVVKCL